MLAVLARASLEGALVAGLVWTAIRWLPRLSPSTRAALWWCAAAKFLLALVWVSTVRLPDLAACVTGVLAAASLWIYLLHWQVYPHLENGYPVLAVLASLAVGIGYWLLVTRATGYVLPRIRPALQTVSRSS